MTRITLDTPQMRRVGLTLDDGAQTVGELRARLQPHDVASLPPAVAGFVRSELSSASAVLVHSGRRLQGEAQSLRVRAAMAELADGATPPWGGLIDRSGAVGPLAAIYGVWSRGRAAVQAAAHWYLHPRYATIDGLRTTWQRTVGESITKRVSAFRSYPQYAGAGVKGAAVRWSSFFGSHGAALTKVAKGVERSATKKIPIVGDALTWTDTFDSERRAGASDSEAHGAAAGATAGARGGALAGAAAGAAIGAFGGPAGAVAGGVIGAVGGSLVGSDVGKKAGKWIGGLF